MRARPASVDTVHLPGSGDAADQRLGERPAAGEAAGATVGVRQHLLDLVDARVFFDVELAMGQDQQGDQDQGEAAEGADGRQDQHAPSFPPPGRFARTGSA